MVSQCHSHSGQCVPVWPCRRVLAQVPHALPDFTSPWAPHLTSLIPKGSTSNSRARWAGPGTSRLPFLAPRPVHRPGSHSRPNAALPSLPHLVFHFKWKADLLKRLRILSLPPRHLDLEKTGWLQCFTLKCEPFGQRDKPMAPLGILGSSHDVAA